MGASLGSNTLGQSCTVPVVCGMSTSTAAWVGSSLVETSDGSVLASERTAFQSSEPVYQDAAGKKAKKYMVIQRTMDRPSLEMSGIQDQQCRARQRHRSVTTTVTGSAGVRQSISVIIGD
jgi:hypothetical protein